MRRPAEYEAIGTVPTVWCMVLLVPSQFFVCATLKQHERPGHKTIIIIIHTLCDDSMGTKTRGIISVERKDYSVTCFIVETKNP